MRAAGLPTPLAEHCFMPGRRWRFDFAWPAFMVALEVEGGAYSRLVVVERGYELKQGRRVALAAGTRLRLGGRHHSAEGLDADAQKYNAAAVLGWMVIRATSSMVERGAAIDALRDAFAARGLE
jgi:hypothetical protein